MLLHSGREIREVHSLTFYASYADQGLKGEANKMTKPLFTEAQIEAGARIDCPRCKTKNVITLHWPHEAYAISTLARQITPYNRDEIHTEWECIECGALLIICLLYTSPSPRD